MVPVADEDVHHGLRVEVLAHGEVDRDGEQLPLEEIVQLRSGVLFLELVQLHVE